MSFQSVCSWAAGVGGMHDLGSFVFNYSVDNRAKSPTAKFRPRASQAPELRTQPTWVRAFGKYTLFRAGCAGKKKERGSSPGSTGMWKPGQCGGGAVGGAVQHPAASPVASDTKHTLLSLFSVTDSHIFFFTFVCFYLHLFIHSFFFRIAVFL